MYKWQVEWTCVDWTFHTEYEEMVTTEMCLHLNLKKPYVKCGILAVFQHEHIYLPEFQTFSYNISLYLFSDLRQNSYSKRNGGVQVKLRFVLVLMETFIRYKIFTKNNSYIMAM